MSHSAVVIPHLSIGAHYTVAWDFGVVILIQNIPHRPIRAGSSGASGHLFVSQSPPARDFSDDRENFLRE